MLRRKCTERQEAMSKILIDCDPGHDDAVAILYAARHLDLIGITTVFGNQSLDHTTRNALSLCRLAGLATPVAMGAARPLVAPPIHGGDIHGKSGIDGADLPQPDRPPESISAVEFILRAARQHRGELVLCAVGPYTNIATALRVEPKLTEWVKAITVMGGTTQIGNTTSVAEFNVYSDPEAADIVFRSGVPLWMVGLNVTRRVGVGEAEIAALRAGGRVARTIGDLMAFFRASLMEVHGITTASLHDPCALVPFIRPEMIDYRHLPVEIALAEGPTRGMTVCDQRTLTGRKLSVIRNSKAPNCHVALDVRGSELVGHIVEAMHGFA